MRKKFIGGYEDAMKFLINIAHKYKISDYDIKKYEEPDRFQYHLIDKWQSSIEFDENSTYNPEHYWYLNNCLLQEEEKIPYYVLVEKNQKNRDNYSRFVEIAITGSCVDFWKDNYRKLQEFYKD